MSAIPHFCAAVLLMGVMPVAAAQNASQKPSPAKTSVAAQPQEKTTKNNQESTTLKKEVDQSVDAIRSYSAEHRDEALANARRIADGLDRQMERLQQQTDQGWARMSQAARTRSQATMADLRKRRNALAEWMGGMRHSSTAAWGEVRSGFVKTYHELADAIREARDEFNKDAKDNKDQAGKTESDGKP